MAPTITFLSGRLGRALYVESGAWWVADAGLLPRPARASEVQDLETSPTEFSRCSFNSIEDLQETLHSKVHLATLKYLMFRILDPASQIRTKLSCAEAIEPVLSDSSLAEHLSDWLMSAPVEQKLDWEKEKTLSSLEGFSKLRSLLNSFFRSLTGRDNDAHQHHAGD